MFEKIPTYTQNRYHLVSVFASSYMLTTVNMNLSDPLKFNKLKLADFWSYTWDTLLFEICSQILVYP